MLRDGYAGNGLADYIQSEVLQRFEADATFTHVELLARIRRMRPSLTFSISLIIAANLHTAIAQSSPTPAPTPVTLRSLLSSELHSTHDNAEWFTPIKAALAGLTAEQAKWVPQNAQGKIDPSANHSVGMLAYHLVFWNENALARLRGEKPASPGNNQETFNDFDAAHWDQIVQRLDRVMKDLEAAVEKMPEEKLALKAPLISHISMNRLEENCAHPCFALMFRGLISAGERLLAFGEFSSLRTHSGGLIECALCT